MLSLIAFLIVVAAAWYLWERSHRATRAMTGGVHEDITLPHEQTWELYHNALSLCSRKTRVCLAELRIPYKSHHIDLIETGAYENISRHFLKVNPAALVPVLVHNGHPIYESHDQLAYAAAHSNQPQILVPQDEAQRRVMDYWVHKTSLVGDDPISAMKETAGNAIPGLTLPIFVTMLEAIPVHRIVEGVLFHRLKQRALLFLTMKLRGAKKLPATRPMVNVIAASRNAMHGHLDELEGALAASGGPWIAGAQFTLADVGMMAIFERLKEVDWLDVFLTPQRPNVTAYWAALQARPSYQSAIAAFAHPTIARGAARVVELKQTNPEFRYALLGPDPAATAPTTFNLQPTTHKP